MEKPYQWTSDHIHISDITFQATLSRGHGTANVQNVHNRSRFVIANQPAVGLGSVFKVSSSTHAAIFEAMWPSDTVVTVSDKCKSEWRSDISASVVKWHSVSE